MFRALLALVLLPSLALAQAEEKLEIRNLGQCGLVTRYASSQIGDTCLSEAENIYLDEDAGITRRKGFSKFNTTAITDSKSVRGVWPFRATDGTEYLVSLSSETMFQSDGDGSFSAISPAIAGKSSTQDMDCQQCLGKLWCVNGSDSMFFWDGSSTGTVSGAPTCSAIDCFRNRIALSNCSGTLSQLRMSGELDGTDWTISASPVSTSPVAISIGGVNDGKKVQCIQGVYQDVLVLGKEDSTWGLYGFDRRDFAIREISREVGCIENRSGREKQGSLYWLSKRGVEKMTGPSITRVSDSIRDLVDTIIVAGGNSRSALDTTQSDFEAGNLTGSGPGTPMSATIIPASVVPGTWTVTDSTFTAGSSTLTAVSQFTLRLSTMLANAGFENGSFTNWTAVGGFSVGSSGSCLGTYEARIDTGSWTSASGEIQVLNGADDAVIYSQARTTPGIGSSSCSSLTLDISTMTASTVKVRITDGVDSLTTAAFQKPAGVLVLQFRRDTASSASKLRFDFPEPFYASSGTYLSQAFDTGISTQVWGVFSTTYSFVSDYGFPETRSSVRFETQVATSASGVFTTTVTASDQVQMTSQGGKFVRYLVTMQSPNHLGTPVISTVTLKASTTGYFISQCRNPGTAITQWGLFQCNRTLNGGDISYAISIGTTCHGVTRATATWTAQTNNTIISVATASYVAYRTLFDLDTATDTPTLNDCTINWNEGTSRPSVAAEVYRDRYYLAYTSGTTGTVANDRLLVLDSRDQWVLHDQPNCTSLGIYNRKMYCGDSGSTGRVYQMDIGQDDDGSSFTSNFKTKDFDFGNTWQKKHLSKMYFDLAGLPSQDYSISLTPSYTLDASTDVITLNAINLNEDYSRFIAAKVPADLSNNTSARWYSFGLTNTGSQGPWKIFGLKIIFSRLSED